MKSARVRIWVAVASGTAALMLAGCGDAPAGDKSNGSQPATVAPRKGPSPAAIAERGARPAATATPPAAGDAAAGGGALAGENADAAGEGGTQGGCAHTANPPHGGVMVSIGDHFAHLELVIDAEHGLASIFVLDGDAYRGVRVKAPQLTIRVQPLEGGKASGAAFDVNLAAIGSRLTGESVGDTSQFTGAAEPLRGLKEFTATLAVIEVKGQTVRDVVFRSNIGGKP